MAGRQTDWLADWQEGMAAEREKKTDLEMEQEREFHMYTNNLISMNTW